MSIAAQIATRLNALARAGADELLPRDCFLCAATGSTDLLCPSCADSLPRLAADACPVCALPTPGAQVCGACLKRMPHFDATCAVYRYEFPVDGMIHELKYAHRLASADYLGRMLAQHAGKQRPDVILPVPLSAARLAQRGFNQSVEIARPLARALGVPLLLDPVRRCRDTAPQASLPWPERSQNIRHAFECTIDLAGMAVMVVDDVMTTGATLNELARVLKAHGAARVENQVVARTLKA